MWDALQDLAETLEAMADGTAADKLYLSSLDPGVGKTRTIVAFIDALLSSPLYQDVGVLVCVARLSEVKNLAEDAGIPDIDLAVVTSDEKVNALGKAAVEDAQVLITTQQMVEKRVGIGRLEGHSQLYFKGHVRTVRIWDETYLPGCPLSLGRYDLTEMLKPMCGAFPKLTQELEQLFVHLGTVKDGTVMQLPDYAAEVDLNDLLRIFDGYESNGEKAVKDAKRQIITSLWQVSGKTVSIRRDGQYGNAVIDYRDTLPVDLAPMVILDASGRVRSTYRDIEQGRGTLVRLKSAVKRYDQLTVNVWSTGGGKTAFKDNGDRLTAGIAATIDTKPGEQWLVVTHKEDKKGVGNIPEKVSKLLKKTPSTNVSFISWGQHMATNDYVSVSNIILAGTLFYRTSHYEATKRLAADRPATKGEVSITEIKDTEIGEHKHAILQALCRGSVRRCDGEHCHPCEAWIIASVNSGIKDALPDIFPGVQVNTWRPVGWNLKGHVKAAADHVEKWMKTAKVGDTLPFKTIAKAIGISPVNFKKDVRPHPEFRGFIAELGLVPWGKGAYFTAYLLGFGEG
jgi:hypothetical protein